MFRIKTMPQNFHVARLPSESQQGHLVIPLPWSRQCHRAHVAPLKTPHEFQMFQALKACVPTSVSIPTSIHSSVHKQNTWQVHNHQSIRTTNHSHPISISQKLRCSVADTNDLPCKRDPHGSYTCSSTFQMVVGEVAVPPPLPLAPNDKHKPLDAHFSTFTLYQPKHYLLDLTDIIARAFFRPLSMAASSERRDSSTELLYELEALSQSLFEPNTTARRAGSLVLSRPISNAPTITDDTGRSDHRTRSHRLSWSPWRSRPNQVSNPNDDWSKSYHPTREKKGIWNWKPMRALSHIGMRRIGSLFSVEVVSVQGLPASMNGLRLSVTVRKKEKKDGAVQTTPSRVLQGSAEFEETLFIKSHLYYTGKPIEFEPRPFLISVVAVDAPELDLGKNVIDLSLLVKESVERSFGGVRVRQWETKLEISGKAKGGELILKLGFQITEDGGVSIYNSSPSFVRDQSRPSFSVTGSPIQKLEQEQKAEEQEIQDFEVIDKGVEIEVDETEHEENANKVSISSEVLKEVVHDDSVTKQTEDELDPIEATNENDMHKLDADEVTMTREFLQMLELGDDKKQICGMPNLESPRKLGAVEESRESKAMVFLSDLGKGLGPVVQTKHGGYLASMNPFDVEVAKKDTPKLAVQVSRPFVLRYQNPVNGLELFQRLTIMGSEKLASKLQSLMDMDELTGKTAEQIAFEGIASAIINGRNKDGASSSATRSIAAVKTMAKAMVDGRKERVVTKIWDAKEDGVAIEEILGFSVQKLEAMAVEVLKIQAEVAEEEAPSHVSPLTTKEEDQNQPLDSAIPLEEWMQRCGSDDNITLLVTFRLRDPSRQYESVGGLVIAVVQAARVEGDGENDEERFKVMGLHVGGLKSKLEERQKLSAMQWLVGYGLGKEVKKKKKKKAMEAAKMEQDLFWSLSWQLNGTMQHKLVRNPDVEAPNH